MITDSIKTYLEELSSVAEESLSHDYNLSMFGFDRIDYINTYIIHQAIEKNLNLHIRTCDKKEKENLYLPAIISVAIFGFLKNYIAYNPIPIVGEIIQKDKKRFTITNVSDDNITIENKAENIKRFPSLNSYKKFIVTTAKKETEGRKLKIGFDHYRKFFNTVVVGGVGDEMPSKFAHKYLIITSKEILDALKEIKTKDQYIYKSLPIRYISSSGTATDNIPIDPMIYIVNDYETAKDFVIKKQNIETIIIIGESKYREYYQNIAQDFRASRIQNAIFIGNEPINSFDNLHRWNWTKPEHEYLSNQRYYHSEQRIILNSNVSTKTDEFLHTIENIETRYNISILRELSEYIRKVSRIIIPKFDSRLNNKLRILMEEFRKAASETIEIALLDKGIYNSKKVENQVIDAFNSIVNSIGSQKWEQLETFKKVDYVVAPKDHIDELKYILQNSKVIPYSELNKIKGRCPKVCFFSIYGKQHFEDCFLSNSFRSIFILYPHEETYFKLIEDQYSDKIKHELSSTDRYELSRIRYHSTVQNESINEMFLRLFTGYDKDNEQESDRQELDDESHIICRIVFDNGECEDIEGNKSVLLCNRDPIRIVTADKLQIGDLVRIYANINKEKLWEIGSANDSKGLFKSIDDASQSWKKYLSDYLINNNLNPENLFHRLSLNGLRGVKNISTIERWLKMNSDTKFPKGKQNINVIKKTINNPDFDSLYQDILSRRRAYFSIMIGLGRDLSDEIINYILSNGTIVGEILSKYDHKVIEGFANANAPISKISNITFINDDSDE